MTWTLGVDVSNVRYAGERWEEAEKKKLSRKTTVMESGHKMKTLRRQ